MEIAKKLGKTPGQIALRWNLQRGISVLPKTATLSRVTEVSADPFLLLYPVERSFMELNLHLHTSLLRVYDAISD